MKLTEILSEELQQQLVEAELTEMANLAPDETGLKYVIWIGEVGGQHGPRIKVSNIKGKFAANDNFVMSISKDPANLTPKFSKISTDDIEDIIDWIKLNYDLLMKIWKAYETGSGTIDLLNQLQKI